MLQDFCEQANPEDEVEQYELVKKLKQYFADNERKIKPLQDNTEILTDKQEEITSWYMIKEKEVKESTVKLFDFFTKFFNEIVKALPKEEKKHSVKSSRRAPGPSKDNMSAMMAEMQARRKK